MIQIKNVSKRFGKVQALREVSLNWNEGEGVALIGPNGSGKTTLMKTILGMVFPDSGQIEWEGEPIGRKGDYRRYLGYMPQIGRYPENMRIRQVFQLMQAVREGSHGELDLDLYEAYAMETMANKRMGGLSGGTRQKVSACLAFMFQPKVYILDEPTAGLDPVSTEILKEKIKKEREKGKLFIISSHILSDLEEVVSQVVYMEEGSPRIQRSLSDLIEETGEGRLGKIISRLLVNKEGGKEQ